jgi:hypothetical protein
VRRCSWCRNCIFCQSPSSVTWLWNTTFSRPTAQASPRHCLHTGASQQVPGVSGGQLSHNSWKMRSWAAPGRAVIGEGQEAVRLVGMVPALHTAKALAAFAVAAG